MIYVNKGGTFETAVKHWFHLSSRDYVFKKN
jgi:hypothetical protein